MLRSLAIRGGGRSLTSSAVKKLRSGGLIQGETSVTEGDTELVCCSG
ncbi:MAG: hypothetical protein MZV63_05500 [Marinilabiliales bacterium]|nr:hypothetical protein [Marinilabiliales bacterium]